MDGRITERIIGCAIHVSNVLGCGFLEKVYENALALELKKSGLPYEQQKSLRVSYDGCVVGEYVADLCVDGAVVVELKAVKALDSIHEAQLLNYLRASGLKLGLLLNFGNPRLQIRRMIAERPRWRTR